MNDPRDWVFADWFRLFLRALPAFLLALLVVLVPVGITAIMVWWFFAATAR
jgi:uncharacterized membrane protein